MKLLLLLVVLAAACGPSRSPRVAETPEIKTPATALAPIGVAVPVQIETRGLVGAELVLWLPGARGSAWFAVVGADGRAVGAPMPVALGPQTVGVAVWSGPAAAPVYFELDGQ